MNLNYFFIFLFSLFLYFYFSSSCISPSNFHIQTKTKNWKKSWNTLRFQQSLRITEKILNSACDDFKKFLLSYMWLQKKKEKKKKENPKKNPGKNLELFVISMISAKKIWTPKTNPIILTRDSAIAQNMRQTKT